MGQKWAGPGARVERGVVWRGGEADVRCLHECECEGVSECEGEGYLRVRG